MDRETLQQYSPAITRAVNDLVHHMAGSISAEHGIGIDKIDELAHYRSKIELDTMRTHQARARSEEHHEPRQGAAAVMTSPVIGRQGGGRPRRDAAIRSEISDLFGAPLPTLPRMTGRRLR